MFTAAARRLQRSSGLGSRLQQQLRCAISNSSSTTTATISSVTVRSPPAVLEDGYFERPTPVLFMPWECRGVAHWEPHMDFLAERGITSAAFNFECDGLQPMEVCIASR
jgi:hypothetical protein